VVRHPTQRHWEARFSNLCHNGHNFLRITRILKCLGEIGFDHFQVPLLSAFLEQVVEIVDRVVE
jgi:hypothetical protein